MDRALKFLNRISVSGAGVDSAGAAEGAADAPGEASVLGEVSGLEVGEDDATPSGATDVDGRAPARVAEGACAHVIVANAKLAMIETIDLISRTSSPKLKRCRLAVVQIPRLPIPGSQRGVIWSAGCVATAEF
jgi:hypothetical protein